MSEWARPDSSGEPGSEPFEVFPTGATVLRVRDPAADDGTSLADHLHRSGELVRAGYDHARNFHARPGPRPGVVPATSGRVGGDADIVRPVLVDPATASHLAISGTLFAAPIAALTIDEHDGDPDRYLVWNAHLSTDRGRPIPATLHLLGSPSMVVTVLELVPRRRLRWRLDGFVRVGVAAIEELAHRLEAACRPLAA